MTELPQLETLSHQEKDALIRALWDRVQALEKKRVKKTPKNSSVPPSQGFKANLHNPEQNTRQETRKYHHDGGRELTQTPDQIVIAVAQTCPHCGIKVTKETQKLTGIYERIELPVVRPVVTRVERYGGTCPCCQKGYEAEVPVGLEPGSPFGDSVAIMVCYLRYAHGISYERLSRLMAEVYGVSISEGGIANLLKSTQKRLESPVASIVDCLRRARWVGSDETVARVKGMNQWEWVFQNTEVCLHLIRPSRGKQVIEEVMGGHCPEVWVSDLFSSQKANPAQHWQVCLAHQLRDCQYAIDAGDDLFAPRMKRLFLRAIALQRRCKQLASSTVRQYCARLRQTLNSVLRLLPTKEEGQKLLRRYQGIAEHLLLFLEDESLPPTNNASEQALRWSVIFRKITNGFRSEWGAELFSLLRSVIDTARRRGISTFEAISLVFTSSNTDWLLG